MTDLLLEHGARLDIASTALLGDAAAVARLLEEDPSLAAAPALDGAPPLHHAAALIARGADIDARADMGQTPLHLCATAGLARLLVEAGADPAAVDDEHGTTPLTWARVGLEIQEDSPARRRLVEYLEQVTPGAR